MVEYNAQTYGDAVASAYSDLYGDFHPPPEQIAFLAELARDGPAVEVGCGDGRVAIPLAATGVPVVGIDASAEMTKVLAARAEAHSAPVLPVHADAGAFAVPEPVPLVFTVFNTFFLFADEGTQAAFLRRASRALRADGRLVIETFVPRPGRLPDGPHPGVLPEESAVVVKQRRTDRLVLFAATHGPERRRFDYHEIVLVDGQPPRLFPGSMRYCWPKEIDALAEGAGLVLHERWENWDRTPFGDDSAKHVSVYRRR